MAYLDLIEPDPDKNRRNGLIVFVICVILLGTLVKCAGQSLIREDIGKTVKRISTDRSLMFFVITPTGGNDTIFVGLYADSLGVNSYHMSVYIHYPKEVSVNASRLDVGFDKGGIESLESSFIKENYVEYKMTASQHNKLKNYKYEYINFHIDDYDIPFVSEGEYFMRFFKAL